MNYKFVTLKERNDLVLDASKFFSSKWGIDVEAYYQSINDYINHKTEYGWYLCLDNNKIVGGIGVIDNDFHERKDLFPNLCALYVEEEYRNNGIGGNLLKMAVEDLKSKGINKVYLITEHINYYERYGFKFLTMVKTTDDDSYLRMYYFE